MINHKNQNYQKDQRLKINDKINKKIKDNINQAGNFYNIKQQQYQFSYKMGRKQDKKNKKQEESEEEEEVEEQSVDQEDQQENQDDQQFDGDFDQEQIDGDEVILKKIEDKIIEVDQEQKLSWAAIYQIKKQEADLNDQMQKQIDDIKEKYEIKRIPLMTKVAEAVAGFKLEKSLYSENEFVKSINLNKTKPKSIPDYWGKVFDACGLIGNEDDIELLENLTLFKCELIDPKVHNIRLTFEFQENDHFDNKIVIQVSGSVSDGNFTKNVKHTVKSKPVQIDSLFGLLTDASSDNQQFLDTCHDLYRSYTSSTYFYFYEPTDDLDEGQGDENQNDEGQQGSEEEEASDEEDIKPVKKTKGNGITEKPECKQQ